MGLNSAEVLQAGVGEVGPGPRRERALVPWVRGLLVLGVLGLLARALLVMVSIGSHDMLTWQSFAAQITQTSIGHLYDTNWLFNHPPLMGLFASLAYSLSQWASVPFPWLFKAPMLGADLATACLLYWSYKQRGPLLAALLFAVFCWNPVSFLISSYHGNTDSLCASLLLLAAVLMDLKLAFWAGLALAGSINVKLVPVLLILPLLACVDGKRQALRFIAGLSLGVIPFLPYLIGHWAGFYAHALAYRSYSGVWGIGLIATKLASTRRLVGSGSQFVALWTEWGTSVVLLWPVLLALLQRLGRARMSARQIAATTMLGFIVLTPGWGVQYLVYPAALLFAVSLNGAVWYSLAAGAYLHVTYMSQLQVGRPYFSDSGFGESALAQFLGGIAWATAARVVVDLLRLRQVHPLPVLFAPGQRSEARAPFEALRAVLGGRGLPRPPLPSAAHRQPPEPAQGASRLD
jgi:hypothetical protein